MGDEAVVTRPDTSQAKPERLTPMMAQYLDIKAAHADYLLFYRMGDFYELFFEDALVAARALSITLTKRGKHLGEDIAMCGVPVHTADDYLQRLIAAGFNVAVCEQVETPQQAKKRGGKSLISRQVTRLVTPATVVEDTLLDARIANYLGSLAAIKSQGKTSFALAFVDISTGIFKLFDTDETRALTDIMRFEPKELIVADSLFHDAAWRECFDILGRVVTPQPSPLFDAATAQARICAHYGVATLEGFATFSPAQCAAAASAIAYLEKTQISQRPDLMPPIQELDGTTLLIDAATRLNLELCRTQSGTEEGSLLKAMDRTVTGSGARLLRERLMAPLTDVAAITARLDSVSFFRHTTSLCEEVRLLLEKMGDMPRALSRLGLGRGGPRDMATIAEVLEHSFALVRLLRSQELPAELAAATAALAALPEKLKDHLNRALAQELPPHRRDGGFIRVGYSSELDNMRSLRDESRRFIAALQARYAQETGIKNLKIKHNNILGFFVEVAPAQAPLLGIQKNNEGEEDTTSPRFIHRQSVVNAMRFTTNELGELEARIMEAGEQAQAIENQIFDLLCTEIMESRALLRAAADGLSVLDVSHSLALLAEEEGYCRPQLDNSLAFEIVAGRHPVVEQALRCQARDPFVANDCYLSAQENEKFGAIWLLTGPNMGGKSTFLRQNALIVIMAQMGSFVPAGSATLGVVDRLFSRVGASDDLARGRSTFMVEMVETAAILNQAGERSLVILDEIGRGTSTFDGLSIAWGTLEYLHEVNHCRAIFATHFHEMTVLVEKLPRLYNRTMKVKEWKGEVIFLHEIAHGAADRSYGVQVAKLAGLPAAVVARARDVLRQLEAGELSTKTNRLIDDLPLFSVASRQTPQQAAQPSKIEQELDLIKPDELTPRQALETLYHLKGLLDSAS